MAPYFKPSRKNQDIWFCPLPSKPGSMKNNHLIRFDLVWFDATKKKLNNASLGNSMACLTLSSLNTTILIFLYQAWSWLQASHLTTSFNLFLTCIFFYYLSVFAAPWLWILFKQLVHFKTASATSIWGKRVSGLWRTEIIFYHF